MSDIPLDTNVIIRYLVEDPEEIEAKFEGVVRWKHGADLASFAGRPVRLRFALKGADLYAFRFRPAGAGDQQAVTASP